MKKGKNIFGKVHRLSAVIMLITLLWLTVCTPFLYADQQVKKELLKKVYEKESKEDNPLSKTSEERAENDVNTLSEFLHENYFPQRACSIVVQNYKCQSSTLYFAFHPEMISPPPEA